jgi:hypothetical protein
VMSALCQKRTHALQQKMVYSITPHWLKIKNPAASNRWLLCGCGSVAAAVQR